MQRNFLRLVAPALLLAGSSDASYGGEVVVTVVPHDYEIRQDYTRREIRSLRGSSALAYTQANFGMELSYRLAWGKESGHIVATLHAKLIAGHQQIQIPSEFSPDSCEYRVLFAHELLHVERNVQAMTWLKQEIEREESIKPVKEFAGKMPDEVRSIMQAELDTTITKYYMKKYGEVRRQLNEPLDSESRRVEDYGQCHNWQT